MMLLPEDEQQRTGEVLTEAEQPVEIRPKREGYRGFISLLLLIWKKNKEVKQYRNACLHFQIKLPIKWWR